jgi:hypothetical protein
VDFLDNVGSLTSHKPIGLHSLLRGVALLTIRELRKLHIEKLHNLQSLSDIKINRSRRMKLEEHAFCAEVQSTSNNSVEKLQGKGPLDRPRSRCEDNIN